MKKTVEIGGAARDDNPVTFVADAWAGVDYEVGDRDRFHSMFDGEDRIDLVPRLPWQLVYSLHDVGVEANRFRSTVEQSLLLALKLALQIGAGEVQHGGAAVAAGARLR